MDLDWLVCLHEWLPLHFFWKFVWDVDRFGVFWRFESLDLEIFVSSSLSFRPGTDFPGLKPREVKDLYEEML